jgi:hypothetical protein
MKTAALTLATLALIAPASVRPQPLEVHLMNSVAVNLADDLPIRLPARTDLSWIGPSQMRKNFLLEWSEREEGPYSDTQIAHMFAELYKDYRKVPCGGYDCHQDTFPDLEPFSIFLHRHWNPPSFMGSRFDNCWPSGFENYWPSF